MANKQTDDRLKRLLSEIQSELESLDEPHRPVDTGKDSGIDNKTVNSPNTKVEDAACPFLKTVWDKSIRYGYPNEENYCNKPKKAHPVSLTYQKQVCLTNQFSGCPIYTPPSGKRDGLSFFHKIFNRKKPFTDKA
jgi:hypothetical protein